MLFIVVWWMVAIMGAFSDPQANRLIHSGCSKVKVESVTESTKYLNATLLDLRAQLNSSEYFATAQQAGAAGKVFGMVQCRKYLSTADCVACLILLLNKFVATVPPTSLAVDFTMMAASSGMRTQVSSIKIGMLTTGIVGIKLHLLLIKQVWKVCCQIFKLPRRRYQVSLQQARRRWLLRTQWFMEWHNELKPSVRLVAKNA